MKILKKIKSAINTAKAVGGAIIDAGKGLYEHQANKAAESSEVQQPITQPTTTPTAPITYEEYINQSKQTANTQKQATYADAAAYRQKAISDAYSAYALNKADYGNTANALSQMGLSGSGYSDYINSQAYAQQRGEVQAARTNEAAIRQGADVTYANYMSQLDQSQMQRAEAQENERKTMYYRLWEGAQKGAYSAEAIEAIGNRMGLKYADIEALKGVIKEPTANTVEFVLTDDETGEKRNITIANAADIDKFIADGTIDNKQALDAVNEDFRLTTEEYNAKLKVIQDKNAASIEERLNAGEEIKHEDIIGQYTNNNISKAQISSIFATDFLEKIRNTKSEADKETIKQNIESAKSYLEQSTYNELIIALNNAQTSQDRALDYAGSVAQYSNPDTASQAMLANTIIDSVKEKQAEKKADLNYYKAKSGTEYSVTDKSTGYGVNSASLTLGENVSITYADGTTDDAYLSLYAAKSTRKEMDAAGVKVGEVYKAKNGNYYLRGKTQYFKLKNVDASKFEFDPIEANTRRGKNVVLPGGLGGR